MAYGSVLADTVQGSTSGTPPTFKDGNGTQIGTLCRAWVNFNGTGTVAIRASFNVSSITDNGTGKYVINFSTALPNANYSCVASATPLFGTASTVVTVYDNDTTYTANTTGVPIIVRNQTTQSPQDVTGIAVAIFD